ncbi:hypothetical protein [Reyranella soli]|uniref:Uncharacterized protein n=1 Tax=Reyranella soli TaxID=1230389 RepID=A0A512NFY4_9HYPH|nr:hypothetical protein [Reyranella soli]GEP57856.1 hypothetical protein RSO01_50220 [Reyranella soli]
MTVKRVIRAKPDPAMLLLLAAVGIVGLLVVRRYGVVNGLRTVNRALGIARMVRSRPSAAQPARKRPARRVRPKVLRFSRPR